MAVVHTTMHKPTVVYFTWVNRTVESLNRVIMSSMWAILGEFGLVHTLDEGAHDYRRFTECSYTAANF